MTISKLEGAPAWLMNLAQQSCEEIEALPKLDNTVEGQTALPEIEEKVVTSDYIDFLREQIQLNARGPEWTQVLQRRLQALAPFVGKPLLKANFFKRPNSATLNIDRETGEVVHVEFY